jgi:hypothetical protein
MRYGPSGRRGLTAGSQAAWLRPPPMRSVTAQTRASLSPATASSGQIIVVSPLHVGDTALAIFIIEKRSFSLDYVIEDFRSFLA